jgi:hypothetical protein
MTKQHINRTFIPMTFDPNNREHVTAYLCLIKHGRQHPNLRFEVEYPFLDVRSMMHAKISEAYIARFHNIEQETQLLLGINVEPANNVRALGSTKVSKPFIVRDNNLVDPASDVVIPMEDKLQWLESTPAGLTPVRTVA